MPLAANMNISTNLNGRLRNTSLPLSCGLLPLFEAVINSIHGLEEANIPIESGWIRVVIERDMVHSLFDTVEDKKSGRRVAAVVPAGGPARAMAGRDAGRARRTSTRPWRRRRRRGVRTAAARSK